MTIQQINPLIIDQLGLVHPWQMKEPVLILAVTKSANPSPVTADEIRASLAHCERERWIIGVVGALDQVKRWKLTEQGYALYLENCV